jgi:hypothetical protein
MIAGFLGLLFNPSAWAAVALSLIMGFSTGYIKGYDTATAKHRVVALQEEVAELKKAADERESILAEDSKSADLMEVQRKAFEAEIEKVLHAPNRRSNACRFDPEQLRTISRLAAKVS